MPETVSHENSDNIINLDLTEGATTPSIDTQSLDFEIPESNVNLVTSTPYENPVVVPYVESHPDKEDDQETMPNMHITETPVEAKNKKRKHDQVLSLVSEESDNDDLFQFDKKKAKRNKEEEAKTTKPEVATTTNKKVSTKECASTSKQAEGENEKVTNPKGKTPKKSIFSDFLEKTQTKNKPPKESPPKDSENTSSSINKGTRKRPLIQVLGEDDNEDPEDDLFCFGDTQSSKKKCNESLKSKSPTKADDAEEDDLFGFKENKTIDVDEDSSDMQATEQFINAPKPLKKSTSYVVPKPKLLPRTISAIDWISGSLGKIKIKGEINSVVKNETDIKAEDETKPNIDDLNITEDHRKWLDSLKNAIEIQEVSLHTSLKMNEKTHYKWQNQHNTTSDSLNGSRNFKTFVKVGYY